jgi:hypothetical protein
MRRQQALRCAHMHIDVHIGNLRLCLGVAILARRIRAKAPIIDAGIRANVLHFVSIRILKTKWMEKAR